MLSISLLLGQVGGLVGNDERVLWVGTVIEFIHQLLSDMITIYLSLLKGIRLKQSSPRPRI